MTAFVYTPGPTEHAGLNRIVGGLSNLKAQLFSSRLKAAATIAAVVVVADLVLRPLGSGLASGLILWGLAFGLLIALPTTARTASKTHTSKNRFANWKQQREQSRADAQMWQAALEDGRIMADLSRAMSDAAVSFPLYRGTR